MDSAALVERLRPWLRETHAPAYEAALEWLLPRCRTVEERALAPALLLLLSPLNALVVPCRPVAGSCVNFQVTLSRAGAEGPERVRLMVRAGAGGQAVRRSGGQAPLNTSTSGSTSASGTPERLNSQVHRCAAVPPERRPVWLDAATVVEDPLAAAARALAALLPESAD